MTLVGFDSSILLGGVYYVCYLERLEFGLIHELGRLKPHVSLSNPVWAMKNNPILSYYLFDIHIHIMTYNLQ